MNLDPVMTGTAIYPGIILDAAIAARGDREQLWVIRSPDGAGYMLCEESVTGKLPRPACMAWLGVFVETDRFTDPVFRLNFGPNVWPEED